MNAREPTRQQPSRNDREDPHPRLDTGSRPRHSTTRNAHSNDQERHRYRATSPPRSTRPHCQLTAAEAWPL